MQNNNAKQLPGLVQEKQLETNNNNAKQLQKLVTQIGKKNRVFLVSK